MSHDGSFQGGQTLQSYVAACYPDKIMKIVDPTLLSLDNRCLSKGGISCNNIDAEKLQECMVTIFRVGLQCSQESSRARMHIRNTIRELETVKDVLLNYWWDWRVYSNRMKSSCYGSRFLMCVCICWFGWISHQIYCCETLYMMSVCVLLFLIVHGR